MFNEIKKMFSIKDARIIFYTEYFFFISMNIVRGSSSKYIVYIWKNVRYAEVILKFYIDYEYTLIILKL